METKVDMEFTNTKQGEMGIYAIKDCKLGKMTQTFQAENDEIAKRTIMNLIKYGHGGDLANYSKDFQLYKLGTYLQNSGDLKNGVNFVEEVEIIKNNILGG